LFRDSSRSIPKVCDGLHEDPKHYEKHFEYLAETNISRKVEKNLEGQLGREELFFSDFLDLEYFQKILRSFLSV
jgi:hypothetical protein